MSDNILEYFISQYLSFFISGNVTFYWHGGEPMLAGLAKFKNIVELQKKYNRNNLNIKNCIQSNGTLINEDWCKFIQEHNFKIGISLDGPEEYHDKHRKFSSDKGSFKTVNNSIELLKKHNIKFGIILTLTRDKVSSIDEILNYIYETYQIKNIAINPYYRSSDTDFSLTSTDFFQAFKKIFDWFISKEDFELDIREINNFLCGINSKFINTCRMNGTCTNYLTIDFDGKVYHCDRIYTKLPSIGDLNHQKLIDILNDDKIKKFHEKIVDDLNNCGNCVFINVCKNGCTSLRNKKGKYIFCNATQKIYNYIAKEIYKNYTEEDLTRIVREYFTNKGYVERKTNKLDLQFYCDMYKQEHFIEVKGFTGNSTTDVHTGLGQIIRNHNGDDSHAYYLAVPAVPSYLKILSDVSGEIRQKLNLHFLVIHSDTRVREISPEEEVRY